MVKSRCGENRNTPGSQCRSKRDIVLDSLGRSLVKKSFNEVRRERKPTPRRKGNVVARSNDSTVDSRSRKGRTELQIARDVDEGGEIRPKDIGILREMGPKESKGPHLLLVDMLECFRAADANRVAKQKVLSDIGMGLDEDDIGARVRRHLPPRL
jgi:hypothetical protein